jgi:hypothetical protein
VLEPVDGRRIRKPQDRAGASLADGILRLGRTGDEGHTADLGELTDLLFYGHAGEQSIDARADLLLSRRRCERLGGERGEAFDAGETFSGVDFQTGLQAVERICPLIPENVTMAQFALRWILMFDAVTCAIPGAKSWSQAMGNARASAIPALSDSTMSQIRSIYDALIREQVHQRW